MSVANRKESALNSAQILASEAVEIAAQIALRNEESAATNAGPCAEVDLRFEPRSTSGIPDRFALAFSGGGIRSACVALGILQALSEAEMLDQVHYISAISGGGYMLGWLTAWTSRLKSLVGVQQRLKFNTDDGQAPTVPMPPTYERHIEPFPVHYLRRYTSYLAPRSGLLSGDTLAMISVYLRNVLLNQTMLACLALSLMLVLQLPAFLNGAEAKNGIFITGCTFFPVVTFLLVSFASGIFFTAQSLYRLGPNKEREWRFASTVAICCGVASCVSLWLLTPYWYIHYAKFLPTVAAFAVLAALGLPSIWYYNRDRSSTSVERGKQKIGMYLLGWLAVTLVGYLFHVGVHHWLVVGTNLVFPRSYAVLGLCAFLIALSLESYLWVGIAGLALPDSKREWLARAAGWFLAIGCIVALIFAIGFYGPVAMHLIFTGFCNPGWKKKLVALILPGGWLFTVVAGLIGGSSSRSGDNASGSKSSSTMLDKLLVVAPPVFLLGVLMLASWASNALVRKTVLGCSNTAACSAQYLPWADWVTPSAKPEKPSCAEQCVAPPSSEPAKLVWAPPAREITPVEATVMTTEDFTSWALGVKYFLLFAVLLCIGGMLAWRLDVNEFSLHLFYRNRLVRAFLGASRSDTDATGPRVPSPFTGFAYGDDVFLTDLTAAKGFHGPYPIWGTCLNLTAGEELAWQQRKGASYIFSPLFCGWDFVDPEHTPAKTEHPAGDEPAGKLSIFGYRPTLSDADGGGAPLIGTAMAASGAAVSPNWGYHSKPAIAALLAIFNLRLGWWAGNPRHKHAWKKYAPSIWYLVAELAGLATDRGKYVYLSDGGHFENLGLYELVRRRVRFIICSDADADPAFSFGDLGNAIDHCRRDFGVEIKIGAQRSIAATEPKDFREAHYAIGEIFYPGEPATGILLYIKSSLTNDEPGDVLGMKAQDPNFPHDTTLNQFFTETLFESYRALGQHMMECLIGKSGITQPSIAPVQAGTSGGDRTRAFFTWLTNQRRNQVNQDKSCEP